MEDFYFKYIIPLIIAAYIGYSALSPDLSQEQRKNGVIFGLILLVLVVILSIGQESLNPL